MSATKTSRKSRGGSLPLNVSRRGNAYSFRKGIPEDVRHAFGGRREYVRSLGDVSLRKAEELAALHRAYCNRIIDEARGIGAGKNDVVRLVRLKHVPDRDEIERAVRDWLLVREQALGTSVFGAEGKQIADDIAAVQSEVVRVAKGSRGEAVPLLTKWIADHLVDANDWDIEFRHEIRRFLEDRVWRAQNEFAERVAADQGWDGTREMPHPMFDKAKFAADRGASSVGPISIGSIFEGYLSERQPAPATVKAWTSAINSLIAHLGHDDAARVSIEDIVSWKNALLAEGDGQARGAMTVRHKYLGAVKPVFGWAKDNLLIATNPIVGVRVRPPKGEVLRGTRGYTAREAQQVLSAAYAIGDEADRSFLNFAKRWLPWLCAYTGARVGELAQLRRQDVAQNEDGIW